MIRVNNANILLVFFTILLTSCNPTDTFILKSKTDLGLYPGDKLSLDLDYTFGSNIFSWRSLSENQK